MPTRPENVSALFAFLHRESISFALLGDGATALHAEGDHDIDVVVDSLHLQTSPDWADRFCAETGGRIVQLFEHEATAYTYVFAWSEPQGESFLKLDLCSDYMRDGQRFLTATELLDGAAPDTVDYPQPISAKAFIYYLLKKIDKPAKLTGMDYLFSIYQRAGTTAQDELRRFFSAETVARLQVELATGNVSFFESEKEYLRREVRRHVRSYGTYIRSELPRIIRRIMRPTGLMVVLLGPDGSGKTTVGDALAEAVAPLYRRTRRIHLRTSLRPEPPNAPPISNPHSKPPRGRISSMLKIIYWWLEYTGGYILSVYPALVKSTLVVFDRYYDDILIDPRRYRWGGGRRLAQWVGHFIPKPDLVFVLHADADTLLARKQEVPKDELERQLADYQALGGRAHHHLIDVGRPVPEIVRDMTEIVLQHMNRRWKRRWVRQQKATSHE